MKTQKESTNDAVHFHSSDDRFCGSTVQDRRFSLDPNEVTCKPCMEKDCFVLSATGWALVSNT